MTLFLTLFLCGIASYLAGSLPFGLWVGLIWKHVDIRTLGSKNIGATNVLRVLGPGPGIMVALLDTLKGSFGILLARILLPQAPFWALLLIGLVAILGHSFSAFLHFKGGKGVATSLGVLLALNPYVALVGLATWLLCVVLTRYVSVASLAAAFSLPFAAYFIMRGADRWWMVGLCAVLFILVTVKHRGNIQRLRAGTESKIGQRVTVPEPSSSAMEVH